MQITAGMVKELRQRTGAGMMECKKALTAAGGDMDAAIEQMRISGLAKADKKSDRVAAEGVVAVAIAEDGKSGAIVEINSETDFVSKGDDFNAFAGEVANVVLTTNAEDVQSASEAATSTGESVDDVRKGLIAKLGENIQFRRFSRREAEGKISCYLHGSRIGVLVDVVGGDDALAKDIAMHVAASRPMCISEEQVPADVLEKEKSILIAEAKESGKPEAIIEKMVEGRVRKYLAEITLVGQPFVKDPDQTVAQLLKAAGASVAYFERVEVGEGIEKKEDNFAEEVMAQAKGAS